MQKMHSFTFLITQDIYDALVERAHLEERKPGALVRIILKRELLGDVKAIREPLSMVK